VLKFNGTEVSNLRHLAELVIACQEPFMRFDMAYNEVRALPALSQPAFCTAPAGALVKRPRARPPATPTAGPACRPRRR
jgi:hypothetical protein